MRTSLCLPALALLFFLPARADESAASRAPASTDGKKTGEKASCCPGEEKGTCPKAKGAASMTVARDPVTGALRPLTTEEARQLLGARSGKVAAPQVVTLPDGTRIMRLGPDHGVYSVARRNPDGTVTNACVHGIEEAEAFIEAGPRPPPAPASREK